MANVATILGMSGRQAILAAAAIAIAAAATG
jgi:hypothetical protein